MSDDLGLGDADAPRPLPRHARDRIEQALLDTGEGVAFTDLSLLAGLDAPRALPPALRERLTTNLARRRDPIGRRRAIAAVALFVLVAGAAALASGAGLRSSGAARAVRRAAPPSPETSVAGPIYAAPPAHVGPTLPSAGHLGLAPFASCDELLAYFRNHAAEHPETIYGVVRIPGPMYSVQQSGAGGGGALAGNTADRAVPAAGAPGASSGTSTSNVQEPGVDEPDVTKTDGEHLYVLELGRLDVVDITGDEPVVLASVAVDPNSAGMFLSGHDLLVLSSGYAQTSPYAPPVPTTTATSYDVSDPSQPRVRGAATLDGQYVAARFVDDRAQIVTTRAPALPYATADGTPMDPTTAVAGSTIEQWIGDRPCTSVQHPDEFSGLELTTISTIDPAAPSADTSTSLVAGGGTVYASAANIYVAEQAWPSMHGQIVGAAATTSIHRFGFDGLGAFYVASGTVPGRLLDQFSMSESGDFLRVATTTRSATAANFDPSQQTSGVTVLRTDGTSLVTVGQLSGLAPGETITGARFVGARAYLVTAVQMHDPLFVIDLSDPTAPTELGHVELPGFSAYVHPLDDGHILAIGPDGANGVAAKLFDVSDPTAPTLTTTISVPNAWSPVQADHLAFLYWPARGLAVVPYVSGTLGADPPQFESGALAVHFDGSEIHEDGRLVHTGRAGSPPSASPPYPGLWRSVVARDRLFTISTYGVLASDLDSLGDLGWAPLPTG